MTALAELGKADRQRLLEHLAEADQIDRLMRQPGGLPSVPEPRPLHRRRDQVDAQRAIVRGEVID